jgi:hypothetical protein
MFPLRLFLLVGSFFMSTALAIDPESFPLSKEPPDLLTMQDGTKITTKAEWEAKRKPELRTLFQDLMYGQYPQVKTDVKGTIVHEEKLAFGGKGTLREVALKVTPEAPPIYVLVVTPNSAKGPVPVFVGLMFGGNHHLTDDPKIHIPDGWLYPGEAGVANNRATAAGRGKNKSEWPIEMILNHGYALAVAYNGDITPDNPKLRVGLADLLFPQLSKVPDPAATATIMAWAWGMHRMVDYVSTLPEIDAKRIAGVGHSRLGKATILAGALDERISLVIPNQAGCGGTAPNRRTNPKSEPVPRINTAFPHWFNGNYKLFNEKTDHLPFDQHALVAMCAPRKVLFTNATEDQWADPAGQFEMLKAANPVYALYGVKGMTETQFPADNHLVGDHLAYWIRSGTHAMSRPDWVTYLAFADKAWK